MVSIGLRGSRCNIILFQGVIIYPVYNIPTEAVGRRMQFVLRVQVGRSKNPCVLSVRFFFFFQRTASISSAYIIRSFLLNCSSPPIQPVSPLLHLLHNLLLPKGLQIRAFSIPFSTAPFVCVCVCVCVYMCMCTHKAVCHLISFQTKFLPLFFFVLSHKAAPHACACSCSLRFRAELKETWIDVFRAASVPFFISYS